MDNKYITDIYVGPLYKDNLLQWFQSYVFQTTHTTKHKSMYLVNVDSRNPFTGNDCLAGQLIYDVRHVEALCQIRVAADELLEALLAPSFILIVTLHAELPLGHLCNKG